jgi:hypothetical protein
MSTTITNEPSNPSSQPTSPTPRPAPAHRRRRVVLAAVVAAALGFGAGAAVVGLTDSGGSTTARQAKAAPAQNPKADVQALWNDLSTLSSSNEANVVAGLAPSVRAQLQAVAEGYAAAAEHH